MTGQARQDATGTRGLSRKAAQDLRPGDAHYSAYVGPPGQWDIMGATQFRLLTTLGLRESHRVLDVGCGALRAGRLLIPYLEKGAYHGIEPNQWLIEDAITAELGADLIALKAPRFSNSTAFAAQEFGVDFDFILAQSIFSHAGPDMVEQALAQFALTLAPGGLALATFIHAAAMPGLPQEAAGWTYPGCTTYTPQRVIALIAGAGLAGRALPWYHPRQTWYAMARTAADLPDPAQDGHLSGAILRTPEFAARLPPAAEVGSTG